MTAPSRMNGPISKVARYLTYKQAADYLALPRGTLRALVSRKRIPHFRIGPRSVTFDRDALDQWIGERKVAP